MSGPRPVTSSPTATRDPYDQVRVVIGHHSPPWTLTCPCGTRTVIPPDPTDVAAWMQAEAAVDGVLHGHEVVARATAEKAA